MTSPPTPPFPIPKITVTNNNDNGQPQQQLTSTTSKKTRAYGKLILLGEHFVVYNVPALVGAVAAYTDCAVEFVPLTAFEPPAPNENKESSTADNANDNASFLDIIDNRPAVPNYKQQKQDEMTAALLLVLQHLRIDLRAKRLRLTFGGTLCCASGIGASAAQVVSLARALAEHLSLPLTEEQINQAGYEGEKGYHGTPSGIDNTAATYGGVLKFQRRTDADPIFQPVALKQPIRIVYASTGITSSTTQVVGDVRAKKEADPAWFDALLQKYVALVPQAEQALTDGNVQQLGALLNANHVLCQELTVSCPELDHLVDTARRAGAVGAKMSGTGRGGLMLALTPTEETQNTVAQALEAAGAPMVWKTELA